MEFFFFLPLKKFWLFDANFSACDRNSKKNSQENKLRFGCFFLRLSQLPETKTASHERHLTTAVFPDILKETEVCVVCVCVCVCVYVYMRMCVVSKDCRHTRTFYYVCSIMCYHDYVFDSCLSVLLPLSLSLCQSGLSLCLCVSVSYQLLGFITNDSSGISVNLNSDGKRKTQSFPR